MKLQKNFITFKYVKLTDYTKPTDFSFLMDLSFGSDLTNSEDYGSIGTIKDRCYLGKCLINLQKQSTYNCSLACLNNIENCFNGENLCEAKECETYIWTNKNKACHEFNRIKIWRNTQIKK